MRSGPRERRAAPMSGFPAKHHKYIGWGHGQHYFYFVRTNYEKNSVTTDIFLCRDIYTVIWDHGISWYEGHFFCVFLVVFLVLFVSVVVVPTTWQLQFELFPSSRGVQHHLSCPWLWTRGSPSPSWWWRWGCDGHDDNDVDAPYRQSLLGKKITIKIC